MKGKSLKFKSKLEKEAYDIICSIYEKTLFDIYLHYYLPDVELEVDIAIPQLHLAFEIQGEQHRQKDHYFNKNKREGFYTQQERDRNLKEILEINNWRLIEIYPENLNREYIEKEIFGDKNF